VKICTTCGKEWPDETKFCPNDGSTLRSAGGAADLIGSVIGGKFHIQKKLGEGGMGAVYLGEHVKMGRKCAIKVMSQSMANDPDAIARFNREATNASKINHPNVCAIYDFGEEDRLIYLAMEFIEGEALKAVVEREGALAPKRAAAILEQAGDALQAAHDLGIVHRDLKPDNIMITKARDGADVVKVVDFGIAKAMTGEEGQKVTKTGLVVGTPEYMSPEQLSGDKLDGRSDIYSLALVFYRMLTGTLPFQADSAQETMIKRLTDDPLPLNQAVPGANFPDRLQAVMDKALARMPSERYTSAAEFARDAVGAVSRMTGAAVGSEGATQIIAAPSGAATTAPMAKTRVATAGAGRTRTPDTPAPAAPPPTRISRAAPAPARKKPVVAIAASVAVLVAGGAAAAVWLTGNGTGVARPDSTATVIQDTAAGVAVSNRSRPGAGETSRAPRPTGADTGRVDRPVDRPVADPPVGGPATIQVAAADADAWLFAAFERLGSDRPLPVATANAIRDTAQAYYLLAATTQKDKAFAAYVIASAYVEINDLPNALRWAREAVKLDPGSRSYEALVTSLSGRTP
jgi:serine/threonine-protein kinase